MRPSSTATLRSGSQCSDSRSQVSHARRADHHGGEGIVRLQGGQRLDGLAEALLVGDEGAPSLQRVAHASSLERVKLAAELKPVELGVLGIGECHRRGRALVLGPQLGEQLAHRLVDTHSRVLVREAHQVGASAGSAGTPTPQERLLVKKRPRCTDATRAGS